MDGSLPFGIASIASTCDAGHTIGPRVTPPNHAFQGSAGQRGWPVPSSLRSSAPPERGR